MLCLTPPAAFSRDMTPNSHSIDFGKFKYAKTYRITKIISPTLIQTQSGALITLSGIQVPKPLPSSSHKFDLMAMHILADMLTDKDVTLYANVSEQRTPQTNRMGHILGHVVTKQHNVWAQGMLLQLGLARTFTTKSTANLSQNMYAAEATAKAASKGLWSIDEYKPFQANAPASIPQNRFAIIEGTVIGSAKKDGRIFINFGQDWRNDFTAIIPPDHKSSFFKANIDPQSWVGKHIQVRGWVEFYNGPMVRVTHPAQIRALEEE